MKLQVKVRQPRMSSYSRTWTTDELRNFLTDFMDHHGVYLTIHASDGTKIEVYPKCSRCGCYNTIVPLHNGKCEHCASMDDS